MAKKKKNNPASRVLPEAQPPQSAGAKCLMGLEANVRETLEKLESGIPWKELTKNEKLLTIKYFLDTGEFSLIEIAKILGISTGSVKKYKKQLDDIEINDFIEKNVYNFAVELYNNFKAAYRLAMKTQQPRSAAYALQSMVNTLQSLGVLYKAPARKQIQADIRQTTIHTEAKNYSKFIKAIEGNERGYETVLSEMIKAIDDKQKQQEGDIIDAQYEKKEDKISKD